LGESLTVDAAAASMSGAPLRCEIIPKVVTTPECTARRGPS
jgi:hypothetical protein